MMGAGIAYANAMKGIPCVLREHELGKSRAGA
jgi:hypothetical protein